MPEDEVHVEVDVPAPAPEPEPVPAPDGTADIINHDRITALETRLQEADATIAELRADLDGKADQEHYHGEYVTRDEFQAEPEPEPEPETDTVVIEAPEPEPEPESEDDGPTTDAGHKKIVWGW